MNDGKIESLLNEVKQIVKIHEEYANKQGENFNIFSILRMGRKEVETHSRFIYELLNPKGKHGQDDIFLKSFAKIVLGSEVSNTAIDPQREDLTTKKRRIDFTLETDANIIGIEMKIDAGDQKNQLFDYHKELKNRADKKGKKQGVKLFYLTLNGSEASKYSHTKNGETVKYKSISFDNEILNWIDDCIQQSAEKSVLREALIQYKILIEKLTGKNTDMNTEIAKLIGKNTENFKSALELEKGLTQAKIKLQIKFWEELLAKLGEGFEFGGQYNHEGGVKESCSRYYNKQKNRENYGIEYKFNNNEKQKLMLIIDIKDGVYFCLKTDENNQGYVNNKIKKSEIEIGKNGYFFPESRLFSNKENNNLIEMMLDENAKNEDIKNLAQEFKELVEKLEKS